MNIPGIVCKMSELKIIGVERQSDGLVRCIRKNGEIFSIEMGDEEYGYVLQELPRVEWMMTCGDTVIRFYGVGLGPVPSRDLSWSDMRNCDILCCNKGGTKPYHFVFSMKNRDEIIIADAFEEDYDYFWRCMKLYVKNRSG